jgi:hypothetical protein
VTYAGSFGLPQSGGLIIVRPTREPLRVAGYEFDRHCDHAAGKETELHGLLRELVALKQAKKK